MSKPLSSEQKLRKVEVLLVLMGEALVDKGLGVFSKLVAISVVRSAILSHLSDDGLTPMEIARGEDIWRWFNERKSND